MSLERLASFALPNGFTRVQMGVNRSVGGVAGAYANWGDYYDTTSLNAKIALKAGIPLEDLSGTTGFDGGWHQPDGISRQDAVEIQLQVAERVIQTTMDVAGWKREDVDGIVLGSGVPVVDVTESDSMVDVLADRMGFPNLKLKMQTFAACNSGQYGTMKVLGDEQYHGMKILFPAIEGVTHLNQNFDPKLSNPSAQQMFSDGIGVLAFEPGVHYTLLESVNGIFPDTEGFLTADMTYKHLIDWERVDWQKAKENPGQIWQVFPATSENSMTHTELIVGQTPPDGMKINMEPKTAAYFGNVVEELMGELDEKIEANHPGIIPELIIAHQPHQRIVEKAVERRKRKKGLTTPMPWVVRSGNSSAATSTMAWVYLLDKIKQGETYITLAYGAGGSGTAALIKAGTIDTPRQRPEVNLYTPDEYRRKRMSNAA